MSGLTCCVWWLLFGVLLGLLVSWVLGRLLYRPRVVVQERVVEKQVAYPEILAQRDRQIETLRMRIAELEQEERSAVPTELDHVAAVAAGFAVRGMDDLCVVEGIGPKVAELLNRAGIRFFSDLSAASVTHLRNILNAAGPNFRLVVPDTWPAQAAMASENRWADLRAYQDRLNARGQ